MLRQNTEKFVYFSGANLPPGCPLTEAMLLLLLSSFNIIYIVGNLVVLLCVLVSLCMF